MRIFHVTVFSACILLLLAVSALSSEVKNERGQQDGNRVLFEYDLVGEKETEVNITLTVEGKKYTPKDLHLEGDYGKVSPGKGKRIYWNLLQDFPKGLHGSFEGEILAGGEIAGMVFVKGGCFEMGDTFGDEKPVHNVCVKDFYMGKYEVTQRQWTEVMGNNPSNFKGCDDCPVEQVSWNDIQEYIRKLNGKTGNSYRLPTEAEWEYAARSGGKREKFAGTSSESELGDYAWYSGNAGGETHPVGQKRPNGLGLYDMNGNVWEWVEDWYGSYNNSPKDNPKGPVNGKYKVYRGGSWNDVPGSLRASDRYGDTPVFRDGVMGFRLVRDSGTDIKAKSIQQKNSTIKRNGDIQAKVNVSEMVFVKGGCFEMGDTFGDGQPDEKPVHTVCVDDFYMGMYEVTQRQWMEVMGNNPSYFRNCNDCPVEKVSWNEVQEYIRKLNNKTGQSFRLPTEAEWEYAARSGGKREKYAGTSNEYELGDYAWYDGNAGNKTHPVGQKKPNGLGLYDMTGNVREWVGDWYYEIYYRDSLKDNPKGPSGGSNRVYRGGSWVSGAWGGGTADRNSFAPVGRIGDLGFRLVRDSGTDVKAKSIQQKNSTIKRNGDIQAKVNVSEMVFVKGGCFEMGDTFGDGQPDEKPVHTVCVDDFYMGMHYCPVVS